MITSEPRTYGYKQLADRIEKALGVRPAASALRAAATRPTEPSSVPGRPRLTAGMPTPLPSGSRTAPARFDASAVDAWLASHPRRTHDRAIRRARNQLAAAGFNERRLSVAVATAREAGLAWSELATLFTEVRVHGHPWSKSAVHQRYRHGHLTTRPRSGPASTD